MKLDLDALAEALEEMALSDTEVRTFNVTEIEADGHDGPAIDVTFGRKGKWCVTVWEDGMLARELQDCDAANAVPLQPCIDLGDITTKAIAEAAKRYGYKAVKKGKAPAVLARVVAPAVYHALKGGTA